MRYSPRCNPDLPSWTLSNTSLDYIPQINFLDFVGGYAGLFHRMLDDDCAELWGGETG
jgi:hypothetical protein